MGLFDALPAPKRPAEGEPEATAQRDKSARTAEPDAAAAEPSVADLEDLEDEGNEQQPAEAAAADEQPQAEQQQGTDDVPPPPPPPPPPAADEAGGPSDQVAAALRKIAGHIGHPKKFAKASQLLRELLAQGAIQQAHGPLLFSALKAAMRDPAQAADPMLAREYSKLFTAASKVSDVFTIRDKNQLDVYGTWAVLRTSLATTDDSFAFNKVVARLKAMVVARLKAMVEELPEATEEDEEHQRRLQASAGAADPVLEAYDARLAEASGAAQHAAPAAGPAAAAAAAAAEDVEADPFGLDALLEQQAAAEAAAAARKRQAPKSATWSSGEVVVQRRAALLDCLDTAKASYRHLWARTSVDLLVEHYHQHKSRFTASQRARVDELMGFVRDQRRLRKLGPSAKEVNRDTTSFERARAEWSRSDVSHRGKVGSKGDHRAENWLG
ncbi:hypothetical protein C2E21_9030 [Chlorella sorokiniana]|uniref:Uncharacterized protein n=1 Tax=Chlorella sorokiniana TaxID=3076 RepID=A0A2P6TCJ0_CHLSO|nr:hypothetical protein C2E21_9030 [Chlorella sorokiniana]|eukprot:PRW20364.1 hypothetical protein C2E21_9030 [Chlorella sorokiniana]